MSLLVMSSLCFSFLLLMPSMMQPLSLGLCIMVFSALSCVLLGLVSSSWYAYILFLVYVGGLLVMFAYVSALAPNNFFSSTKSIFSGVGFFLLILGMLWALSVPDISFLSSSSMLSTNKLIASSGSVIVSPSSISVMIVLGVILLINLLAVVKVCYYQQGPLRSHFELK
uniref:NADH-ubiquinone oxidoreductase chain 6 n=1 Tax=Cittarium pica TaxID=164121 RepID=A0A1W5YRS5_CITPI|nr:NADH dehydrogenase subunit 6 [Cittarium pica]